MVDDLVVGGGIAGLATAFRLQRQGRDVHLWEASPRVGGLVRTVRRDGCILEQGPETLQTPVEVCDLVADLGLVPQVVGPHPASSDRFVLYHGQLVPVPLSPGALWSTPLLSRAAVLRLLAEPFARRAPRTPETVAEFVARRLGPELVDALVDPFIAGVFGGDPHQLDVESAFGVLVDLERRHGSLLLGALRGPRRQRPAWAPRTMLTFRLGMDALPRALAHALGSRVHLEHAALSLSRDGTGWRVSGPAGSVVASRVWVACPLPSAARLVGDDTMQAPRVPLAAVHLGFAREDVAAPGDGFGWLAPSHERRDVLGCIWVSSVFPGHAPGVVLRRLMFGGARNPDAALAPRASLIREARGILREVEGLQATPILDDVAVYREGIPQYPPGWARRVAGWQGRWPGVRFTGWGISGIGLSHQIKAAAAI